VGSGRSPARRRELGSAVACVSIDSEFAVGLRGDFVEFRVAQIFGEYIWRGPRWSMGTVYVLFAVLASSDLAAVIVSIG
jgi:hypothetical protein